jgi:SAM-dependent methyltransferase
MHKQLLSDEKSYWEDERLWNPKARVNSQEDRVAFASSMIPKDVKTIVDLGCGNGLFLNSLKNRSDNNYDRLLGLERSRTALNYVETDRIQADVISVAIRDETFDLVAIMEVIEHLSVGDFAHTLVEIARISKKYVLVSVPYMEKIKGHFIECKKCKTRFHRNFHKQSFDTDTVKSLFNKLGFRNIEIRFFGKKGELVGLSWVYSIYKQFNPPPLQIPLPCPVCGFVNGKGAQMDEKLEKHAYIYFQGIYNLLSRFWPKQYRYVWVLALYEREV